VQSVALAVLLLPAAGALLLALGAFRVPRAVTQGVGPGVVWASFVCVLILLADSFSNGGGGHDFTYWTWLRSGAFDVPMNLVVDRLSLFMGLVITGVGGLIVTYAVGYMGHEGKASYARFFCYMDLFVLSMLLLVLAGNFVILIVGWAGVGLSSYLLIGFYYWRYSAVVAARKAFVMNVIGDVGLILAAISIFTQFHATTYAKVFAAISKGDDLQLEIIAFLLLVGAVAKSAQLPLHTWLPDAMEGPTPVSALIHAATMVTAGVYLIGRMHPIYNVAWVAADTAALIGALSALFAATVAVVQTDIKRVLAYSTMSQIGYMFMGAGLGAYAAAFFHLLSHAFFKALLFMSAGNVIHAMEDEQDMRKFGGLWNQMRLTSIAFLIGSLSLVGILPLAGFFSKELILGDAFSKPAPQAFGFPQAVWLIGLLTAILTGFYTGRMWWMAFWGEPSKERPVEHPHEAPRVMLWPVLALAFLTVVGGFVQINAGFHQGWKGVEDFLAPVLGHLPWEERTLDYIWTAATMLLGGVAFWAARYIYVDHRWRPWSERFPFWQRVLEHKYYFDEAYNTLFVGGLNAASAAGEAALEKPLFDGAVDGVGAVAEAGGGSLSLTQSGYFRNYALVFLGGVVVAGGLLLYRVFA
jgi:NADH-quinone oxidoreductase subunit L